MCLEEIQGSSSFLFSTNPKVLASLYMNNQMSFSLKKDIRCISQLRLPYKLPQTGWLKQ